MGDPVATLLHGTPLHLGPLHPYETVLVLLVAFGPFLVVVATVMFRRRRDGVSGRRATSDRPAPRSSTHP